jgi:hypothetical protein
VPAQRDGEDHDGQQEQRGARRRAGQPCPPTPMMVGMKGGAVCAWAVARSTAKACSFQAKIRQKMTVEAMPMAACGSTTLRKAWNRVQPSISAASSYSRGISSMTPLRSRTASEVFTIHTSGRSMTTA